MDLGDGVEVAPGLGDAATFEAHQVGARHLDGPPGGRDTLKGAELRAAHHDVVGDHVALGNLFHDADGQVGECPAERCHHLGVTGGVEGGGCAREMKDVAGADRVVRQVMPAFLWQRATRIGGEAAS